MDIFHEQLVKRHRSARQWLIKALALVGLGFIAVISLIFLMGLFPMNMIPAAGLVWLAWYVSGTQDVEYEYILTNDDLDIDKIIAKRKRKRLITTKVSKFTDFGIYTDEKSDMSGLTLIKCTGISYPDENGEIPASVTYFADFPHNALGNCRLLFSPNPDLLEQMSKALPRALRISKPKND
ncbi:MAG: hypothetical protein LBM87_08510 [Ruminococcus sp.]|jgi:hypothetical protein|nr:hypothetical protein [Ruminococcus sp.]